jgi:hypothetical protein
MVQHHVPTIDADELARQRRGDALLIVDTRTPGIPAVLHPRAAARPGGELALRIHDLVRASRRHRGGERAGARAASSVRACCSGWRCPILSLRNGTSGGSWPV